MTHRHRPGYIILLQGHRHLGIVGVIFRYVTEEQLRLPLAMLAIIPAHSKGEQSHVATSLQDGLRRDECSPIAAITVNAVVIATMFHHRVASSQRCICRGVLLRLNTYRHQEQKKKYPKIDGFNIDLDKEYIEKMIQVPISIPELSNKDIQNYLLLLVLQKYLKEEAFNKIIKKIEEEKIMVTQSDPIEIRMIESYISNISNSVPLEKRDEYKEVMDAILQIRSIAAYTLKGNPRQIKRFLNTFVMKRQLSKLYYGDELDMKIMAKLLILHKLDSRLFDELNEWNSYYDTENENYKLMREALKNEAVDEYKKWQRPQIKKWVECEPVCLERINLDRYFYLTREILNTQNEITVDLSASARKVLERIGSISKANVLSLIDDIKALSGSDLDNVMVVILAKIEKKAINVYVYSQLYLTFEDYRQQICKAIIKSDYKIKPSDLPLYREMYKSDRESIGNLLEELQTKGRIKTEALSEITREGE